MQPAVGFDFGTTNCALAVVGADGAPRLAHFAGPDGDVATFRSILYFDREEKNAPAEVHAGPGALLHYLVPCPKSSTPG
jgi:molecular chaperone DnaK (HSP70)